MAVPTRAEIAHWTADERAQVAKALDELVDQSELKRGLVRRRQLVLIFLTTGGVLLLPWIGYLAVSLPDASRAEAWKFAWVGFDTILAVILLATAWLGFHRRMLTTVGLAVAATMLCVDAWFDLTLSFRTHEQAGSIVSAFIELPFAVLLILSARSILRRSMSTVARLRGNHQTAIPLWRQPMVGTEDDPSIG